MPKAKSHASSTKRQRWTRGQARAVLEKQPSSGLTVREFAEREGLEPVRLQRWRERLGGGTSRRAPRVCRSVLRSSRFERSARRGSSSCSAQDACFSYRTRSTLARSADSWTYSSEPATAEPPAECAAVRRDAVGRRTQGRWQPDGARARRASAWSAERSPVHLLFETTRSASLGLERTEQPIGFSVRTFVIERPLLAALCGHGRPERLLDTSSGQKDRSTMVSALSLSPVSPRISWSPRPSWPSAL